MHRDSLLFQSTEEFDCERHVDRIELKRVLEKLMAHLTKSQRQVLILRFGLREDYAFSCEETARVLRISRQRVRAIECITISKLRHPRRRTSLTPYLWLLME